MNEREKEGSTAAQSITDLRRVLTTFERGKDFDNSAYQ